MDNPEENYLQNVNGRLSPSQIGFLLMWLAQRMAFIVGPILFLAFMIRISIPVLSIVLFLLGTGLLVYFVWVYSKDIFINPPVKAQGLITKLRVRRRGPAHYYLLLDSLQVRVRRREWMILEEGTFVRLYYAKETKWLLSHVP